MIELPFKDIIMVIVVYAITFLIVGIVKFAESKDLISQIASRDVVHIACGGTILFLPLFSDWFYPLLLPLGVALLVIFGLSKPSKGISSLIVNDIQYSKLHSLGPLYYMISVAILIPLFWNKMVVIMAAVMIMAWGDGSASLIAPRIKTRHKYPWSDKSFEGSLLVLVLGFAGALTAWIVGFMFGVSSLPISRIVAISFIGAIVGCIAEAASIGPLRAFDNFTVPILSALAMFLIS